MATSTVLYVGDDLKLRIPVMQGAGLTVLRSECSPASIRDALKRADTIDAVVFHSDRGEPTATVVTAVRTLSQAPVVFFQNSGYECEAQSFDLVVRPLTPPAVWLTDLAETIRRAHELYAASKDLCRRSEAVRAASREIREISESLRDSPFDPNALWRGEPAEEPNAGKPDGRGKQQTPGTPKGKLPPD